MTSGDVVYGVVSKTILLDKVTTNCNCPTYGDYETSLQIINASLKGTPCDSLTQIITPIVNDTSKSGCKANT